MRISVVVLNLPFSPRNRPRVIGHFLRAGYMRIQDSAICIGFPAAPERPEHVAVEDRLTGGMADPVEWWNQPAGINF